MKADVRFGVGAVWMQSMGPGKIPAETVRVARAAFPKGSLAITVRDEPGPLFGDEEFADLFPTSGRQAWSPGRLALVLVLQFVEGLTDRQAAEAVRARIDFKYARGLDLEDPGFDHSGGSIKKDLHWNGCKVHFTETCEPDAPNLITNVVTTTATVPDDRMTSVIHTALTSRSMLPAEHWVDTGYANVGAMADARAHGVALHGPLKSVTTAQARAGSYGQDAFIVDWDSKRVTCPNGTINTGWREDRSQQGLPVVRAQFSARDCRPCPVVRDRVPNLREKGRAITLRPQQAHRELQQARALQQTEEWKERYKVRAGIEGTISQGVHSCGLRRSRYRGLAKTSLQHQLTGAAINLARINAHIIETPRARTRVSHFAALFPIK